MHKLSLRKLSLSLLAIGTCAALLVACDPVDYTNDLATDKKDYRGDIKNTWHALAPDQKEQIKEHSYQSEFSYGYEDKIPT